MSELSRPPEYFLDNLKRLGRMVRDAVLRSRKVNAGSFAGAVVRQTSADTIYQLDTHVEPVLERFCEDWSHEIPLVLVAEGIEGGFREGMKVFPKTATPADAAIRLLVDPIDGTRGLMYDKRSAWVLAGVAPNNLDATRLADIEVAVQVEVPTSKQHVSDVLWAVRGKGAHGARFDLQSNQNTPIRIAPSTAADLAHGFASVSSFFPGTTQLAAELMELIVARSLGAAEGGKALVFNDQYISTGGQFYELIVGHDRFNCDLRPLFYRALNMAPGLCVHPYDVATALIAQESGVVLTDGLGGTLDGPLDTDTPLSWAGFANEPIRFMIEPLIEEYLAAKGVRRAE